MTFDGLVNQLKVRLQGLTVVAKMGASLGYADPEFPANGLHVKREPIEKNVAFLDN
jgi:hypothetical protein